MSPSLRGRPLRAALILLATVLLGTATSAQAKSPERLVVRGAGTVADDCGPAGCDLQTSGTFRGTLGTGEYAGTVKLALPDAYANGEGGLCAPIRGRLVIGAGTPDRLGLALAGDSCQDGAGPPDAASFTGLAAWTVVKGTGKYAHAHGSGTAAFLEDAADAERMTLLGRIAR